MWDKIRNPVTGRMVSIYDKVGRKVLNNYIKKLSNRASLPKGKKKNRKIRVKKNKRGGGRRRRSKWRYYNNINRFLYYYKLDE